MKVLRRSRRLACCTALAFTLAGAATATPAQAGGADILVLSHVVASWGDNALGQLGDGTTASRSLSRDIAAGGDVVQVAAGAFHGLALRSDGTVWAWGYNEHGELGDGTNTQRFTPVQVRGLTGVFTQVAAGARFSLALRSDGTVWAWGQNDHGQLGRGGVVSDHEATPARVAVLNGVTQISAGRDFGLALRSDGIVFAWGDNGLAQLGNGTVTDGTKPVKIAGLAQVTGISAGWDSSLATENSAISAVTSVWAWGGNDDGQLGDGTLTGHFTPKRVTGLPVSIAGISVGGQFATVLGTDGSVWGWGTNGFGQLNIASSGAVVTRPVPTIVAGSGITQISAGGGHMLARGSDGTVLAWGLNGRGQLGNGNMAQVSGPVQVTGLNNASQVAAGLSFSLAVHTVLGFAGQSS